MTGDCWYRRGVGDSLDIGGACVRKLSCNVDRRIGDNSTECVRIAFKNRIGDVDIRRVVARLNKIRLCSSWGVSLN